MTDGLLDAVLSAGVIANGIVALIQQREIARLKMACPVDYADSGNRAMQSIDTVNGLIKGARVKPAPTDARRSCAGIHAVIRRSLYQSATNATAEAAAARLSTNSVGDESQLSDRPGNIS